MTGTATAGGAARHGILRPFLMGAGAQAYQRAVTIGAQLVVLPVMLQGWGPAVYGGWVALDSLRAILAMSDLGLAQVAANRMTAECAAGDRGGAARTAATAWAMLAAAAVLIVIAGVVAALWLPLGPLLNIGRPDAKAGLTFALLALVAAGTVLFGAVSAILRAEGLFWLVSLANANFQMAGAAAMAVCALLGTGYVALAAALLALQIVTLGPVAAFALRRADWARPGRAVVDRARLRAMIGPSLALLLYTLGNLVSIQGVTLLVAAALGPVAVTTLSAIRTLTRSGRALAAIVIHPLEPVLAQHAGRADRAGMAALSRRLAGGGVVLALVYALPMALFGPAFLRWWTGGAVTGQDGLHLLMTAAVAAEILWFALQTPAVARNRHAVFAAWVAGAAVLSAAACALLLPVAGLIATGWTLCAMQAIVLLQTLIRLRRHPVAGRTVLQGFGQDRAASCGGNLALSPETSCPIPSSPASPPCRTPPATSFR